MPKGGDDKPAAPPAAAEDKAAEGKDADEPAPAKDDAGKPRVR